MAEPPDSNRCAADLQQRGPKRISQWSLEKRHCFDFRMCSVPFDVVTWTTCKGRSSDCANNPGSDHNGSVGLKRRFTGIAGIACIQPTCAPMWSQRVQQRCTGWLIVVHASGLHVRHVQMLVRKNMSGNQRILGTTKSKKTPDIGVYRASRLCEFATHDSCAFN
jgi:hypothetical protein